MHTSTADCSVTFLSIPLPVAHLDGSITVADLEQKVFFIMITIWKRFGPNLVYCVQT